MGLEYLISIIVGGVSGWAAQTFMKSGGGILMNIILGIVGSSGANFALHWFGLHLYGWIGYLVAGFIGACVLIAIGRLIKK